MNNQPSAAWVEAAQIAAERAYDALGSMDSIELELQVVSEEDATSTNSLDIAFLDFLSQGLHLDDGFLADAR